MNRIYDFLQAEGVDGGLLRAVRDFWEKYPTPAGSAARVPDPEYYYYGNKTWELALAAILAGKNLLRGCVVSVEGRPPEEKGRKLQGPGDGSWGARLRPELGQGPRSCSPRLTRQGGHAP